eukprot:3671415-Pleurochrysis_carterae.AAC.2
MSIVPYSFYDDYYTYNTNDPVPYQRFRAFASTAAAVIPIPDLEVHYSSAFECEHIVTVQNGKDSFLINPFTAVSEDGAPIVTKSIQSMSGTTDGRDIELHIMVVGGGGLLHMHYKNFPLDKCFDYTLNGETTLESPVFAKFGDSGSWTTGAWIGDNEPLQHFGGWTFSSGSVGAFSSSTSGRCIERADCVINNNIDLNVYIAPALTGQGTTLTIYPGPVSNAWPTPFDYGSFNSEDQWELVDGTYTGYFSTRLERLLIIYTIIVAPGSYELDGNLAMYLFADAHGMTPT